MRKVVEQLIDDLTGEPIAEGDGKTVAFSFEGKAYEIDLADENVDAFREALAPYIKAARAASGSAPARVSRASSGSRSSRSTKWSAGYAAVREWAEQNGIAVSPRGRVANSVMEAYEAAHK